MSRQERHVLRMAITDEPNPELRAAMSAEYARILKEDAVLFIDRFRPSSEADLGQTADPSEWGGLG
jgi:hypothetical protein